jgi:hypothetical protein
LNGGNHYRTGNRMVRMKRQFENWTFPL